MHLILNALLNICVLFSPKKPHAHFIVCIRCIFHSLVRNLIKNDIDQDKMELEFKYCNIMIYTNYNGIYSVPPRSVGLYFLHPREHVPFLYGNVLYNNLKFVTGGGRKKHWGPKQNRSL